MRASIREGSRMERFIADLVKNYESGKVDRREFCKCHSIMRKRQPPCRLSGPVYRVYYEYANGNVGTFWFPIAMPSAPD